MAVDPGNEWFATGSADRTIKIWDLASGQLKLTLTGHIEQVDLHAKRQVAVGLRGFFGFRVLGLRFQGLGGRGPGEGTRLQASSLHVVSVQQIWVGLQECEACMQ